MSIEERKRIWDENFIAVVKEVKGPEFVVEQWCDSSLTEDERQAFVKKIKKNPSIIDKLKPIMDLCKRLSEN